MLKNEIRKVYDMPDKPPLYFSTGIRIANILHARLRQKCSSLKYDLFRCNLIASCNCDCGNKGNNKITELRTILQRESQNS